jgi:hypothetical protein
LKINEIIESLKTNLLKINLQKRKNKMKQILIALTFLIPINSAFAHEGHDKTPGAVSAPHGGIMQDLEGIYLELLVDANGIKLFPYDHDQKPIPTKNVKLEGIASFPKKAKPETVNFTMDSEGFTAKVEAKGAHRYTLEVTVSYGGKKEKTKFNVEPQ